MLYGTKKGSTKCTLCGIILFKLNTFLVMLLQVPSNDSMCFFVCRVYSGSFFLLSTDSTFSCVPGDKGGLIFFRLMIFLVLVLRTN